MSGLFDPEDENTAQKGGARSESNPRQSGGGRSQQSTTMTMASAAAKARLSRVATRTPEVMVKITGHAKGAKQLKAHMDYMTRESTLTAFNERDEVVGDADSLKEIRDDWLSDEQHGRKNGRLSTNIALSIRNGDREALLGAGRAFAAQAFDGHDYLIVMHTDTQHPHLHLTVRNRAEDGSRLHVPKGKPQEWRETFAAELRERGINAEATSRAERGKTRKGERAGIRHIRERKTPEHDKSAVAQAMGPDKRSDQDQPWRPKIRERQSMVRTQWRQVIGELEQGGEADQQLAKQAQQFVAQMPAVETREDALRREIAASQKTDKTADKDQGLDR